MQSLIRSKSAGVTGGRGTAGSGPGRDLLYPLPFLTGFTIPLSVLRMSVCVSLPSRHGPGRPGFADVGPKVLIRYYYHSYGSQFLCWCLSFGRRRQKPYLLEGRGGQVC